MSLPSRYAAHREWEKGLAAAAGNDVVAAEAAFKRCMDIRPSDKECAAVHQIAFLASRANSFDLGWRRPASLERSNPETPGAPASELAARHTSEALGHVERGEYPQALESFRACLAVDPRNTTCYSGVRLYELRAGAAPAAAQAAPTEEDKRRAILHWNEGIKAFQKGDVSAARDEWLLCSKFDAGNSDCTTGLARVDSAYGGGQ